MLDVLIGNAETIDKNAIEKFIAELPEKVLRLGVKVIFALIVFVVGVWLIRLLRKIIHKAFLKANPGKALAFDIICPFTILHGMRLMDNMYLTLSKSLLIMA